MAVVGIHCFAGICGGTGVGALAAWLLGWFEEKSEKLPGQVATTSPKESLSAEILPQRVSAAAIRRLPSLLESRDLPAVDNPASAGVPGVKKPQPATTMISGLSKDVASTLSSSMQEHLNLSAEKHHLLALCAQKCSEELQDFKRCARILLELRKQEIVALKKIKAELATGRHRVTTVKMLDDAVEKAGDVVCLAGAVIGETFSEVLEMARATVDTWADKYAEHLEETEKDEFEKLESAARGVLAKFNKSVSALKEAMVMHGVCDKIHVEDMFQLLLSVDHLKQKEATSNLPAPSLLERVTQAAERLVEFRDEAVFVQGATKLPILQVLGKTFEKATAPICLIADVLVTLKHGAEKTEVEEQIEDVIKSCRIDVEHMKFVLHVDEIASTGVESSELPSVDKIASSAVQTRHLPAVDKTRHLPAVDKIDSIGVQSRDLPAVQRPPQERIDGLAFLLAMSTDPRNVRHATGR